MITVMSGRVVYTDLDAADRPLVSVTPGTADPQLPALHGVAVSCVHAGRRAGHHGLLRYGAVRPDCADPLGDQRRDHDQQAGDRDVQLHSGRVPRGLRVTRGLTNLTSQSVPINRIQGVKISQPLLWRPLRWYRVDVDIVGYAHSDSENNETTATSVLLPVADADQVELALGRVLPGVRPGRDRAAPVAASSPVAPLVRLLDAAVRLERPGH